MLPKSHRLPSLDIRRVMRTGRRMNSDTLQLIYVPAIKEGTRRFAIVVPKIVDKRATVRNRLKRLIREALWSELPNITPLDSIVQVKRKPASTTLIVIKRLLHETLERASLLTMKQ